MKELDGAQKNAVDWAWQQLEKAGLIETLSVQAARFAPPEDVEKVIRAAIHNQVNHNNEDRRTAFIECLDDPEETGTASSLVSTELEMTIKPRYLSDAAAARRAARQKPPHPRESRPSLPPPQTQR